MSLNQSSPAYIVDGNTGDTGISNGQPQRLCSSNEPATKA